MAQPVSDLPGCLIDWIELPGRIVSYPVGLRYEFLSEGQNSFHTNGRSLSCMTITMHTKRKPKSRD